MKRSGARWRRGLAAVLPPAAFFGGGLLLWHLAVVVFDIARFILPSPLAVGAAVYQHLPTLANAAALTALGALAGFSLSFAIGFSLAVAFSQSRIVERGLYPYAIFLQTVPIVAIAPLIILWIGHGLSGVIAVSFIISLFPIVANTTAGLTSVSSDLVDLFVLNKATRWQLLVKLRIPHAVPAMLTGARISCGLSVIGAIVGEFFAGYGSDDYGLGYLIIHANAQTKTSYLFATIFFCTLLGLSFFAAISALRGAALRRWGGETDS